MRLKTTLTLLILLVLGHTPVMAQQAVDDELRQLLKQTINDASSFEDIYDAEVWLVDMSGRLESYVEDPAERLQLLRAIHQESKRAGVKPELVLSLIQIESRFDRFALSSVGAQGLMQVMPFWKDEIGRPEDNLMDLHTNLRYGCTILAYYMAKENQNLVRALARYNGSLGKTAYPEKVLVAWEDHWFNQQ